MIWGPPHGEEAAVGSSPVVRGVSQKELRTVSRKDLG